MNLRVTFPKEHSGHTTFPRAAKLTFYPSYTAHLNHNLESRYAGNNTPNDEPFLPQILTGFNAENSLFFVY